MKLRTKLLLSYLIIVLLPIIIIGYFFITRTKDAVIMQNNYIHHTSNQQIKMNIRNKLNDYIKISNIILSDSKLIGNLQRQYTSNSEYFETYFDYIRGYFSKFIYMNANELKISIYTNNKSILSDKSLIFSTEDIKRNEKLFNNIINAKGENIFTETYLNENDKMVFCIGRLLNAFADYKNMNILTIEIPESQLYNLIKTEGENKNIYLLDEKGYIITSTCRVDIGKKASSIPIIKKLTEQMGKTKAPMFSNGKHFFYDEIGGDSVINKWRIVTIISSDTLFKDMDGITINSILICVLSAIVCVISIFFFSDKLTKRLRKLVETMGKVRDGNFKKVITYESMDEIGLLSKSYNNMINRINKLISEIYIKNVCIKDMELKKKEAELNALQSQINPHFLFNIMGSINMNLLKKGDYDTAELIENFSLLLRKSIEWGEDEITLRHEMELVENYLKIQKFRYRDKIAYNINIHNKLYACAIPKFTVQPIVENAVYHGIERKEGKGNLNIYSRIEEKNMRIIVEDDGVGMNESLLENIKAQLNYKHDIEMNNKSIGICNVHERLRLYYGEEYGIIVESKKNVGTRVEIKLPAHVLKERGGQNV